ncbi:MAG: hypothetical protein WA701_00515, partial [Solirubrobacterales bacterium]
MLAAALAASALLFAHLAQCRGTRLAELGALLLGPAVAAGRGITVATGSTFTVRAVGTARIRSAIPAVGAGCPDRDGGLGSRAGRRLWWLSGRLDRSGWL